MMGICQEKSLPQRPLHKFAPPSPPPKKNQATHIRVISNVTLCFTPTYSAFARYPLSQWYPQSKEILLNLGMKCWNSSI